jgi:high affinity Mn2+ porin
MISDRGRQAGSPDGVSVLQAARQQIRAGRAAWAPVAPLVLGLLAATLPLAGIAADSSKAGKAERELARQLQAVVERLQKVEERNQVLERKVQELSQAAAPGAVAAGAPAASAAAPAASSGGATTTAAAGWGTAAEPRLAALEQSQQTLQKQVLAITPPPQPLSEGGDSGPTVEAGVVAVLQNVNAGGAEEGRGQTRGNYRGDVLVTLPAGSIGDAQASAVGQLRFGQGGGVATRPTHTGAVNSTTFEAAAGSDETYAVVAQAYGQLLLPLDSGRFNDQLGSRIEFTLGKMDLFGFFDQNAVAGDEGAAFLNNVFVHNPLLDSGGDIGADAYGFAPGVRVGWFNEGDAVSFGASAGVFASGGGATYGDGGGKPLVIAQLEVSPKQINGEPRGSYRLYAWTNGRTTDLDGREQRHTGIGLSADQRVGRDWNLFGRAGHRSSGSGSFNDAITLGFEHGGRLWGRGRDAAGLAVGLLKTSGAWRDATADGLLAGYAAGGSERIAELYYRIKLNEHLELTPDFQLIQRAGGDARAPSMRLIGLRANLGF